MKKKLLTLLFACNAILVWSQGFYDQNTIQEIRITFDNPNWATQLTSAFQNNTGYVAASSVSINGVVFQNVGVKFKGSSSYYSATNLKKPFHIELDAFQNQDYQGIKDIKLSNVYYDPSFLREVLSYDVLNKYMHSPRANYANLYVNNVLIGLYTNTEAITKSFVNNHFGSNTNAFFKASVAGGGSPTATNKPNLLYLGTNPVSYQDRFEMNSLTGWEELISLTDILNNNTSQIETILDVDRTLWMLAFNNVLVNLDSYTGLINHNYYLYKDESGRFSPISWDLNMSFGTFDYLSSEEDIVYTITEKANMSPYVQQDKPNWPLINKLLANPRYKKMYLAHLHTILSENFSNGNYQTKANALRTLIGTSVQNDTNKFYSITDFNNGLTNALFVNEFIAAGIVQLMTARTTYLQNHPDLNSAKPVITNITPSVAVPLINTNIYFTATVTNTNTDAVFFGYRTNVLGKFTKIQMFDDGAHNDGAANDNVYGSTEVLINNAYMQYYIYAENNTIGAFSPARAEHEFHNIAATNNIAINDIKINEVMAQNTSTITDPANQYEDWIELYNNTTNPILLDGLFLSDTATNTQKWQFPTGITIQPGGYLIVWADEDLTEPGLHADFKLSASGEGVYLAKANGTLIDSVTFGPQTANVSYARNPNGTGNFVNQAPTFNGNNVDLLSVDVFSNNLTDIKVYPNPSNSVINFVNKNNSIEKIEVYNIIGQLLFDVKPNKKEVPLAIDGLQNGTYFAKVYVNSEYKNIKFIKN